MWRSIFILATAFADVIFVVETCRHGARSPVDAYAWDQGVWPQGLGELTPEGMRMHYLNGVEFRSRYAGDLFADNFYSQQIYVRSTDVNRTIMSAQSQLEGLFPYGPTLNSTQVANAVPPLNVQNISVIQNKLGLNAIQGQYQPIPIHVVGAAYDNVLLNYQPEVCPAQGTIMTQVENSQDYLNREANYNSTLKSTVESVFNTSDVEFCDAGWFADAVLCDLAAGYPTPSNLTPSLLQQLVEIDSYCNSYWFTDLGARLASSEFFKAIVKNFDLAITGSTALKFALYSAHDTTLAGFLSGLGVFNGVNPPFASTILFELHQEGSVYFVKVIYNDVPQILPGCDVVMCPYTVFRGFLVSQTFSDINEACQISS
mmetsp:Transcript_26757/g.48233  ORF Transcript_26757/g.48233 Transcript_26757/m.48233 type:complete len:372 (+) Transcript_26757:27-1142(+)